MDRRRMYRAVGGCLLVFSMLVAAASGQQGPVSASAPATTSAPDEHALTARILALAEEPPFTGQEDRQQYMEVITKRYRELVELADQLLRRFPHAAKRDEVLQAKLEAMFALATISGEDLDPVRAEAESILRSNPSSGLAAHAAYWVLRCDVSSKIAELQADADLSDAQREQQYLAFMSEKLKQYVDAYPESEFTPELLGVLIDLADEKKDKAAADKYFQLLEKNFPDHAVTQMVAGQRRRSEGVGKPFELAFTAIDGRKVDIQQMRGKVILVDFWASWCAPCRASMPHLRELYDTYHPQGFDIIGVSGDTSRAALDEYLKRVSLPWPIYFDREGVDRLMRHWGVQVIPTYFVVDKNGRLRSTDARGTLDELIPKLILEKVTGSQ